jgi:hypothetical protein
LRKAALDHVSIGMSPKAASDNSSRHDVTPLHISGVRPVPTPLAQSSRVYLVVSRRISRFTSVERNFKKMKTFIVYDLDSQMPVAVGEQISAETARYCASETTGIFPANLLAEEIDLEKQITY